MRLLGQTFGADIIARIRTTLSAGIETTRSGFSRQLCEWLDWRSVNGKPREIDARMALLALEREGSIELPPAQVDPPQCRQETQTAPRTDVQVAGKLEELGEVSLDGFCYRIICTAFGYYHEVMQISEFAGQ